MKTSEDLKKLWLVTYYPENDLFEEATLADVISHDVDMWLKGRKDRSPIRILSAHDTFEEAHEHLLTLKADAD